MLSLLKGGTACHPRDPEATQDERIDSQTFLPRYCLLIKKNLDHYVAFTEKLEQCRCF